MVELSQEQHNKFYVEFMLHPKVDRAATEEEGKTIYKDVEMCKITMPGGNNVVEKKVTSQLLEEWKHGNRNTGKPPALFALNAYEAWKDGLDAPVEGTDLKNWAAITPAEFKQCQSANIRTVEHLAEASAEAQKRLGMGGLKLIRKAQAYVETSNNGVDVERIAKLEQQLDSLMKQLEKKDAIIEELQEVANSDDAPQKRTRRKRNPETGELE